MGADSTAAAIADYDKLQPVEAYDTHDERVLESVATVGTHVCLGSE